MMFYKYIFSTLLQKPADSKKKKKKKWMDDHYMSELGDGYDESDTFIDNSEAVSCNFKSLCAKMGFDPFPNKP